MPGGVFEDVFEAAPEAVFAVVFGAADAFEAPERAFAGGAGVRIRPESTELSAASLWFVAAGTTAVVRVVRFRGGTGGISCSFHVFSCGIQGLFRTKFMLKRTKKALFYWFSVAFS